MFSECFPYISSAYLFNDNTMSLSLNYFNFRLETIEFVPLMRASLYLLGAYRAPARGRLTLHK